MSMKRTLLLESFLGETRLAVIEDGKLCELYEDDMGPDDGASSIYAGRVENVLPSMNAAFVDIGLKKNGFLSAFDAEPDEAKAAGARIERCVRPGEMALVQVMKPQSGQKGHRLSRRIKLPGRSMVYLPGAHSVGVSRKIEDEQERSRLHELGMTLIEEGEGGVVLRTAAEGADMAQLEAEYEALSEKWRDIRRMAEYAAGPRCLWSNADLALRAVRDMLDPDTEKVWVEGEALFDAVRGYAREMTPALMDRVAPHEGETPLFDLYRVDFEAEKALKKYVWLKSGGSLVIEATEALTVVDVNTGKFTGKKAVEETLFKLNLEAAEELLRQLRLRNVSGIVVVDFIDMEDPAHREALIEALRTLAARDRRTKVVGMTPLGLIEMTRKRAGIALSRRLAHVCGACGGEGIEPGHGATARRAAREVRRMRRRGGESPVLIETSAPAAGWLRRLGAIEGGRTYVRAVSDMKPGEYRISPVDEGSLPEDTRLLK